MAAENFFSDTMSATTFETEDSAPVTIPVGSLKQVTITVEAEHIELTSADTILREDVAKRNLNVSVNAGVAAFDDTIIQEWLGGDGTAATSPTDDNSVATFQLQGQVTSSASSPSTIDATVTGLYFPSLPVMDAQEGQWITHNYQGDGKTISLA